MTTPVFDSHSFELVHSYPGYITGSDKHGIIPYELDMSNSQVSGMTLSSDMSDLSEEEFNIIDLDRYNNYQQSTHQLVANPFQISHNDVRDDESVMYDWENLEFLDENRNYAYAGYSNPDCTYQLKQECKPPSLPAFNELAVSLRKNRNKDYRLLSQEQEIERALGMIEEDENVMCRKGKRGAKHVLLWKFLLERLRDSPELVRWMDKEQGIFRFVDTIEISRQWGTKKGKGDMTFEKLSRAIRHYYKSGFMSRQEGTRLVYKINWKMVPKAWR